ncbi:MAG: hypothetical protein BJ554DRAFT_5519 [Olpidium bornovanus]|uniref:Uncharacterized protein n=1 Tax=Olpidium bornovanus TaxID=278681 RepID=A0A8H8A047_9FUNG|nr:MAG: hypothetical protein BJ554DRAFT_5519 [Olpidium bornovanus]
MAVDGINNFYSGSDYNDTEGKQIMAFNFTTVKRINEFLEGKRNLKHGAMLSAYSFSTRNSDSEILNTAMNIYQKPKSRIPLYEFVKGPPPVERTTKLVPLEVPPFTWTETRTMLQHYNEIKVLFTSVFWIPRVEGDRVWCRIIADTSALFPFWMLRRTLQAWTSRKCGSTNPQPAAIPGSYSRPA